MKTYTLLADRHNLVTAVIFEGYTSPSMFSYAARTFESDSFVWPGPLAPAALVCLTDSINPSNVGKTAGELDGRTE
ncbi:hypothetical protein CBM2626_A60330 [Cupriavidus taiwanensis]|nr:hypothetical protein CBM2626_A60330 [Cupriavidus taiwanensis]